MDVGARLSPTNKSERNEKMEWNKIGLLGWRVSNFFHLEINKWVFLTPLNNVTETIREKPKKAREPHSLEPPTHLVLSGKNLKLPILSPKSSPQIHILMGEKSRAGFDGGATHLIKLKRKHRELMERETEVERVRQSGKVAIQSAVQEEKLKFETLLDEERSKSRTRYL